MQIRPYRAQDRDACLAVLDSQLGIAERARFTAFLEGSSVTFFVMEHENAIVGCGGFSIDPAHSAARLQWGMVRAELQGQGLGRFLLLFRLREIGKLNLELVQASCPEAAASFLEKQGFRRVGDSLQGVELIKRLSVCA